MYFSRYKSKQFVSAAKKFYKREGSQLKEKLENTGNNERPWGSEDEEW